MEALCLCSNVVAMLDVQETLTKKIKRPLDERHAQNTRKLLTITDVFLNQKRVNVPPLHCIHIHLFSSSRKTSVIIETFQLSFHVFVCAFCLEISSFFVRVSSFFPPPYFLCYPYFRTFLSTRCYK